MLCLIWHVFHDNDIIVLHVGGRAQTQGQGTHQETVCTKVRYCVPRDQEKSGGDQDQSEESFASSLKVLTLDNMAIIQIMLEAVNL